MKISVIVPTYKPQSYLWECLDSLAKQTFPKEYFEVILVLNGICDPFKERIEVYLSKYMSSVNVNFIYSSQSGVSNARNVALCVAKGDFVTFIDDDDFVSPEFLSELYEKASLDTISLCCPYAFIDKDMTPISSPMADQYKKLCTKGKVDYIRARKYFSGCWMKLLPMEYIRDKRFDVSFKNGEDCIFMFQISDKFKYVDFTSDKAIYYRRYRESSAIMLRRTCIDLLKNGLRMMMSYTRIYMSAPFKYNFIFYITRMLGAIKNILNYELFTIWLQSPK